MIARSVMNTPFCGEANEWTDTSDSTPLRFRKELRSTALPVISPRNRFACLKFPRFRCARRPCSRVVPISHGSREEFSTGSQLQ
jgi:hypothetical protein